MKLKNGEIQRSGRDILFYDVYDAHMMLVQLRDNPKDTRQRLKYRETDPQYQKK